MRGAGTWPLNGRVSSQSLLATGLAILVCGCAPNAEPGRDAANDGGPHDAGVHADGGRSDLPVLQPPYNVVLFIADGMGFEQLRATRIFLNGDTAPLRLETLPVKARMTTHNASGGVTDSAASATAMATGRKVWNDVLSLATPGDGRPLPTALEYRQATGAAVGLVTSGTVPTDATPAAFAAHQPSRYDSESIATEMLQTTRPDFLAGDAGGVLSVQRAAAAGYQVIHDASAVATALPGRDRIAWLHTPPRPALASVTRAALTFLDRGPRGFFLLVETEDTDTYGHLWDLQAVVDVIVAFDAAVAEALAWMGNRTDTLVIVTSDHETGGLQVDEPSPTAGTLPAHLYTDIWHTSTPVPFHAAGPGLQGTGATLDNTGVFTLLVPWALPPR